MRWLCYLHQSGDWTGDRFIPTNYACRDQHRYRRPNICVNTIHRSQKGVSLHEARAYAATYSHLYSRRAVGTASGKLVLACFDPHWPVFKTEVIPGLLRRCGPRLTYERGVAHWG